MMCVAQLVTTSRGYTYYSAKTFTTRVFKLEGGQRYHDDASSVAAWVVEMRGKGEGNVVLSYKPQGAMQ